MRYGSWDCIQWRIQDFPDGGRNFQGGGVNLLFNKKVLLHERKRHTARHAPSTCCAALSNPDMAGGVPHPRSRGRGYPVPGPGGTPSQVQGGYSIPGPGGTPSQVQGGTPSQVQGVPHPRSGVGWGYPIPGPGGYPVPGWGYPPPPYLDLGWDTPLPRPGMGYPPYPAWDGVPPPEMVDKVKTLPSVILRMRAVIIFFLKTAWKWKNLDPEGGARPWRPPLEPPLVSFTCIQSSVKLHLGDFDKEYSSNVRLGFRNF